MAQATLKRPAPPTVKETRLFIDNKWVEPAEGKYFDAINPATKDFFSTVVLQQQSGFITNSGNFSTLHSHKLIPTYSFNTTDSPLTPPA